MATATPSRSAGSESKRRRRSPVFYVFGTLIIWLTMIAPVTALTSWLAGAPTVFWLLASMPLAPIMTGVLWQIIQSRHRRVRWPLMQYLGWGAVLLPLTVAGAVVSFWLPERSVGIAVLAAWLVLGVAGVRAATRISERRLTFDHQTLDRPYRLVQLSDVHVGSRSADFLHQAVSQAQQHQPDVVLITGDLLDTSAVKAEELEALASFSCPVYLSLGNHERYIGLDAAIDMIEAQGVDILRSRSVDHGTLQIIGIDDADDPRHVESQLPAVALLDDRYRILLYHRPDGWAAARGAGIDLMLSGHTHAGQIWPFNVLVKRQFRYITGLFSEDEKHLYVSPGTGCWGPIMRLGTRSEMTVIDLLPKDPSG